MPLITDLQKSEWKSLRDEAKFLRDCQLRYFLLSITSTTLIFGLYKIWPGAKNGLNIGDWLFLAPLIIILPSWWTFFDKAKTIGRIVGYTVILEKMLLNDPEVDRLRFIGWENSLVKFRKMYRDKTLIRNDNIDGNSKWNHYARLLKLDVTHKFWLMHAYSFLMISVLCLSLGYSYTWYWALICAISALIFVYNTINIRRLIFGRNSYEAHIEAWKIILR